MKKEGHPLYTPEPSSRTMQPTDWNSTTKQPGRALAELRKYCFSLTGQLSTAHGYPSASPTKRDNTPFKKTARSEAVVAEVPASFTL